MKSQNPLEPTRPLRQPGQHTHIHTMTGTEHVPSQKTHTHLRTLKEINPTDKRLSNTRARTSTIRVASSVIEATQTINNNSYTGTAVWTTSPELSLGLDGTDNIFLFTSYSMKT